MLAWNNEHHVLTRVMRASGVLGLNKHPASNEIERSKLRRNAGCPIRFNFRSWRTLKGVLDLRHVTPNIHAGSLVRTEDF